MNMSVRDCVSTFFDEFVAAFPSFDGKVISDRYRAPYLAMKTNGEIVLFSSNSDIANYFQGIVDEYYAEGCRSCCYRDLDVVTVSEACVLGTVTWVLLTEKGLELSRWRESYNISIKGDELKIFSSIDH